MPMYTSPDGRILFAMETAGEGDGNSVVYYDGVPVWDRFSYEASHGRAPVSPPAPAPERPSPSRPPAVGGGLLKVTDPSDGDFINRGYSYWSQAWINDVAIYCFAGHVDNHPRFFAVDIATHAVRRMGPVLAYTGEGEGWYWDREGWIYLLDGPRLRRVNPFTTEDRIVFSIEDTHPGCRLWQSHSSDDGQTHSATVQRIVSDGPYPNIGTVVFWQGQQEYYPAHGTLDESQITSDGAYLIIKEDDDNRIITMGTRETRVLRDADGAVGHSDCGPSIVIGEDNIHGACVYWDLRRPLTPGNRRELFSTWGMGHLSVKGGRCLLSDDTHLSLVSLEGSGVVTLQAHGMIGNDYDHQVMANLDYTGRVAAYLSNASGRMDLYLLLIP